VKPGDLSQGPAGVDRGILEEYSTRGASNVDENEVAAKGGAPATRHAIF